MTLTTGTLWITGSVSGVPGVWSVLEAYETHLRRRGLCDATIDRRLRCVQLLAAECGGDVLTVRWDALEQFLDGREMGARTRTCWLSHLHSFYVWALAHEHTDRDPTARVTRPKMRRLLPRPINETDYRLALRMATPMMRTWLLLGGYAGLRCHEIANVDGADIDHDAPSIRVMGKGQKERVVPLHGKVVDALECAPRSGPVFRDHATGRPYTPAQVSRLIGLFLRSVGVNATAHRLRHRFASMLFEETGDIAVVAELCGHANLENTRIYAEVSNRRKRAAVDKLV